MMHSPRLLLACLFASLTVLFSPTARAQVSADQTLGAEASVVAPDVEVRGEIADLIEGGATRGTNLFHSFSDFNVLENQRVYFANPEGIESILSRVTGDRTSNLFGTLGVDGVANLFLVNPNGIAFGPNVNLDVEGSLYVTTGDAIALGEGVFSAASPNQSQLLSIAPSTSFFNYLSEDSGDIVNRGQVFAGGDLSLAANNLDSQGLIVAAGNLSLLAGNTVQIRDTTYSPYTVFADGEVLIRALGDVDIETYTGHSLHILSGGAVSVGTANVISESGTSGIDFLKETVRLSDGSLVDVDGEVKPTFDIRAGVNPDKLGFSTMLNDETDAYINRPISADPSSANISVKDVRVSGPNGSVLLTNQYFPNPQLEEGDIFVESELAAVNSGGGISAGFRGGGQISLDARDNISVVDSVISTTSSSNPGHGISLLAGKNIRFSSPFSRFTGISIVPDPTVQNGGSDIRVVADSLKIAEGAQINTSTLDSTDAGNIIISAKNLEVTSGAQLATSTFGDGSAGNVILNISKTAVLDGGRVLSGVGQDSKGKGGNIEINAANLEVTNGAILSASTLGEGAAGNISFNILGKISINNGTVSTFSLANSGGQIDIQADGVVLRNDGDISTFVASGQGSSGKIMISSSYTIALEDSDILAFSADGRGGAIDLSRTTLFSQNLSLASKKLTQEELFSLDGNNRVDINATGGIESGAISINDASFIENSLSELPDTLFDADVLVANSCIARSNSNGGTLILTGRDRLPQTPNETLSTPYSTGTVQTIPAETTIAEPQAVYQLADGRLTINRDCEQ